jgi:PIN domain nuclease of toxin-antitoxin system
VSGFLLDTHIWWWYLTGSDRLGRGLHRQINQSRTDCWLSPISVWELGLLSARDRIRIPGEYRGWVEEAIAKFPVGEASLTREVALVSGEIQLPHQDPADHFLAATALVYGLVLMTADERLTKAKWLPTRSR